MRDLLKITESFPRDLTYPSSIMASRNHSMKELLGNAGQVRRLPWALVAIGASVGLSTIGMASAAQAETPTDESTTIAIESVGQTAGASIVSTQASLTQASLTQASLAQASLAQATASQPQLQPLTERQTVAQANPAIAAEPSAEEIEKIRQELLIEPLTQLRAPGYTPGSTAGGPTAFGSNWGDVFVGLSLSNRRGRANEADGAITAGFGLGDAKNAVGLETTVNIGSLRRFAANGDVGFKLHRNLSEDSAIAIGWDTGIKWGDENRDVPSTVYGVATKIMKLRPDDKDNALPLTVSIGLGGGRFRSFEDTTARRGSVGLFGSVGLQVAPQASLVSTWTGRDLNMGVSFVPIKTTPLFITAVAANLLRRNDNETVFTIGIGYGANFAR
jgi:hypothetical protein